MGNGLLRDKFKEQRMDGANSKYEIAIGREGELYSRGTEAREEFTRDYTRILHSWGFRRLRHKTQVFLNQRMIIFAQDLNMLYMCLLFPQQYVIYLG